jgi:hypothetical protein
MKKKPTRSRDRRAQPAAPPDRLLRELYERGMAEVEERRKLDPNYR